MNKVFRLIQTHFISGNILLIKAKPRHLNNILFCFIIMLNCFYWFNLSGNDVVNKSESLKVYHAHTIPTLGSISTTCTDSSEYTSKSNDRKIISESDLPNLKNQYFKKSNGYPSLHDGCSCHPSNSSKNFQNTNLERCYEYRNLAFQLPQDTGIHMIKTGVFNDESDDGYPQPGESITYTFSVMNTGDEILENVEVEDYLFRAPNPHVEIVFLSGDSNSDQKLDLEETWIYSADYIITQNDIDLGKVDNHARVSAEVSGSEICRYSDIWGVNGDMWDPEGLLKDFSNVGYKEGNDSIPDWPQGINVKECCGAIGDGIADDTEAFRMAIALCPDSMAVFIPNGRYRITDWIKVDTQDYFVLRGEDMYETVLWFPENLSEIRPENDYVHARGGGFLFFDGGTHRSIENISLEFREEPHSGHFSGTGANGIYTSDLEHSWFRNIYVKNANLGLRISGDNITVMNILLDQYTYRPLPSDSDMVGHYGITIYGAHNCLVHDVLITGKWHHDIGTHQGASNNVFSRVRSFADAEITHKGGSDNSNLYTEFDLGKGERHSGYSRINTVYWNIQSEVKLPFPEENLNNVAVGLFTDELPSLEEDHWHDTINPQFLCPQNIYLAQLEFAGKSLPGPGLVLPPSWPAPNPAHALPVDDTYISDRIDEPLGDEGTMILANKWNRDRRPFLKFDFNPSVLTSVEKAVLRLYRSNQEGAAEVTALGIEDDSWTEDSLTYNNQPLGDSTHIDTILVDDMMGWYEWDVTSFVNSQLSGDKIVSLYLKDLALTDTRFDWNSKEAPYDHPELILTPLSNAPPQPPLPPDDPENITIVSSISGTAVDNNDFTSAPLDQKPTLTAHVSSQISNDISPSGLTLGDEITYTMSLTNAGNVTLDEVVLYDSLFDGNDGMLSFDLPPTFVNSDQGSEEGRLIVGEEASYSATYTITQEDVLSGAIRNQLIAQAESPLDSLISGQDEVTDSICGIMVLKAFLEGPYDTLSGLMSTFLNDYHLLPGQNPAMSSNPGAQILGVAAPPGQPFNKVPWNYNGTEGDGYGDSSNQMPYPSTVTDWVLVSLREDGTDASSTIWQSAALLHNDGTLQFPDSTACIYYKNTSDYHVVVEHRNHLSAMSNAVSANDLRTLFDFTTTDSWKLGIGSAQEVSQKLLATGQYALFASNASQTETARTDIQTLDYLIWLADNSEIFKYLDGDFDLNGDVNSIDRNIWLINVSLFNLISF